MGEFKHTIRIGGKDEASPALRAVGKTSKDLLTTASQLTIVFGGLASAGKAVSAAMGKLAAVGKKVAKLAGEQELAVARLNAAMRTTGKFTQEASDALQANAAALQQVSRFGDEAIMPVQALLMQFGGLGTDQVPRATKAVLDFAEANGSDLKGAAQLVAKAIGTSTNALSRYGIEIDNSLKGSERFEAIITTLESKVGGTAEAISNTFIGSLEKLNNAWGDLLEKIGDFIITNPVIKAVVEGITEKISSWSDAIQDLGKNESVMRMVTTAIQQAAISVIGVFRVLLKIMPHIASSAMKVADAISRISGDGPIAFTKEAERMQKRIIELSALSKTLTGMFGAKTFDVETISEIRREFGFTIRDVETLDGVIVALEGKLSDANREAFSFAGDGLDAVIGALDEIAAIVANPPSLSGVRESGEIIGEEMGKGIAEALGDTVAEEVAVPEFGNQIATSLMSSISGGLWSQSQSWQEAFQPLGASIGNTFSNAFFEPMFGADSPLAGLLQGFVQPFADAGAAIAESLIQPLVDGLIKFFGLKKAQSASDAAMQKAQAGATAATNQAAIAAMMPGLSAAATASLIATFGASGAASSLLPGLLAAGAASGQALTVPAMADGGRVTSPTLALVGEAGSEVVIPENRPARAAALLADLAERKPGLFGGGGGGGINITLNSYGDSPDNLARLLSETISNEIGVNAGLV